MFRACTSAPHGGAFSPTSSYERQHTNSSVEVDIFTRFTRLESPPSSSSVRPVSLRTSYSHSTHHVQSKPNLLTLPSSSSPVIISCKDSLASVDSSTTSTSLHGKDHDSRVRISLNTSCSPTSSNRKVKEIHQSLRDLGSRPNLDIQVEELGNLLISLHSVCINSPTAVSFCVSDGGVETMLNLVNTNIGCQRSSSVAIQAIEVAFRQLRLLVSSSMRGCQAAFVQSSSVISALGAKLLRVSEACTESAIAILTVLCGNQSDSAMDFCKAVSETSIPSKLVVVLQVASKESTKGRVARLLRLLGQQKPNP